MSKIIRLKKAAKELQKKKSIKLHEAQKVIAGKNGFEDWQALFKEYNIEEKQANYQIDSDFLAAPDLDVSEKLVFKLYISQEDLDKRFIPIPEKYRWVTEHVNTLRVKLVDLKDDSKTHKVRLILKTDSNSVVEGLWIIMLENNVSACSSLSLTLMDGDIEYVELLKVDEKHLKFDIEELVLKNKKSLVSNAIDFTVFEPSPTGLKKAILDATQPVRTLFANADFHDYATQGQGPENKVVKEALFVTEDGVIPTTVSLYRPNTKKGDPRMWFRKLASFASAGAKVSISISGDKLLLINLSDIDIEAPSSCIMETLSKYHTTDNSVAEELLKKLREISAHGLIEAVTHGSTAIGMSIEHALGIPPNSDKKPDYKGIEIKSGRGGGNRTTLFAQVADWPNSPLKSSAAILDQFGYAREDDFKLYCTLSSKKANSQGLIFDYKENDDLLVEKHNSFGDVAVWSGALLRSRLNEKHKETFFIQAKSLVIDGREYFKLESVIHTKNPISSQLMPLIADGVITMDHLIKRKGGDKPSVSEKGPLFKMHKKDLSLLFPKPVKYDLIN